MLISNFYVMTDSDRTALSRSAPHFHGAHAIWTDARSVSDMGSDAWWQAPEGFHHEPAFASSPDQISAVMSIWPSIEVDSAALAAAVFAARRQPACVGDALLIFLYERQRELLQLAWLLEQPDWLPVFVHQPDLARWIEAAAWRDIAPVYWIADGFPFEGNMVEDGVDQADLHGWLVREFPTWVHQLVGELMRWQAPSPVGRDGSKGAGDSTPSTGSTL